MASSKYMQQRWDLTDLYPGLDSSEVKQALKDAESQAQAFEELRSTLSVDIEQAAFVRLLERYETFVRLISRLYQFGFLSFAEDTQDQQAQTFFAQVEQVIAKLDNQTLFFRLWWKGLDDGAANRLMDASGDYRYWLEALRLEKPYTLTEPEEKVINLKDVNGPKALVKLYDAITNRYSFQLEVDGELKELNREELSVYFRNHNPDLRASAYQSLYQVYERDAPILGQIYQYRSRDWRSENVDLRGFASPMSVRNLMNDVPDEIVEMLLEICRENAPLFQRYFELKARWIGMDRLRRYDIYAPVVKTEKRYAFEEAVELVLGTYQSFDGRVADLAQRVLDERHLDSEIRNGKMSGAFCATAEPDLTPWVLQSYNGRPDDVAAMAHELGHAIHSMLAEEHTALTQDASLPLAETASTFGEMLLIDRMLEEDPNPEVQRDLLFRQMDDAYATIIRQAYFALFERDSYRAIEDGASVDDIHKLYFENLCDQFGESLDLSDDFRLEWLAIPHIYQYPFYVYAYAFGQLLVLSLYQEYQQEGESFKPRYLEILAAGGSDSPERILDRAGIDIRATDFWQGGFRVLEAALERLEGIEILKDRGAL